MPSYLTSYCLNQSIFCFFIIPLPFPPFLYPDSFPAHKYSGKLFTKTLLFFPPGLTSRAHFLAFLTVRCVLRLKSGKWAGGQKQIIHVCVSSLQTPCRTSMFSIFSFLEALEELYTPWAMVGSLDQRYMGSCSTVELNPTPVLTGL